MTEVHTNSTQYANKYDQLQKIRILKEEVEKSVIADRISASRVQLNSNNVYKASARPDLPTAASAFSDLNDLTRQREFGGYNPKEGFNVHFDFTSFIPPHFDKISLRFGVFRKNQSLDPYLQTSVKLSE